MPATSTIRSRDNPILQRVGAIQSGKEPGTLVLEGDRLIDDAIAAGLAIEIALVAESRAHRARALEERSVPVRAVDDVLLEKLSRLTSPPGILALAPAPPAVRLDDL